MCWKNVDTFRDAFSFSHLRAAYSAEALIPARRAYSRNVSFCCCACSR